MPLGTELAVVVAFVFVLQNALSLAFLVAFSRLEVCGVASAELVPIRCTGKTNGVSGFWVIKPALRVRIGGVGRFRWREADLLADRYVFAVLVLCVKMLVIELLIVLHIISSCDFHWLGVSRFELTCGLEPSREEVVRVEKYTLL